MSLDARWALSTIAQPTWAPLDRGPAAYRMERQHTLGSPSPSAPRRRVKGVLIWFYFCCFCEGCRGRSTGQEQCQASFFSFPNNRLSFRCHRLLRPQLGRWPVWTHKEVLHILKWVVLIIRTVLIKILTAGLLMAVCQEVPSFPALVETWRLAVFTLLLSGQCSWRVVRSWGNVSHNQDPPPQEFCFDQLEDPLLKLSGVTVVFSVQHPGKAKSVFVLEKCA